MEKRKRSRGKTALLISLCVLLALCLIPFPFSRNDGGTMDYTAVLYRVIVWHQINPAYNDTASDDGEPPYLTGTNVYIFPFNFRNVDYETR